MPGPNELRAGDADRDRIAERLREAVAEGRLDAAEFAERLDTCYRARTLGELVPLTADLPPADFFPTPRPLVAGQPASGPGEHVERRRQLLARLSLWAAVFAIVNLVWVFTGTRGGYWPGWLLVWLAVIVVAGVRGREGREPPGRRSLP